jgi:hypothetical protein
MRVVLPALKGDRGAVGIGLEVREQLERVVQPLRVGVGLALRQDPGRVVAIVLPGLVRSE